MTTTARSHQSRLLLYVIVCALALVIGWTTAEPAGASHGNGVSRVCEISYPTLRLESVSYDNPFDPYAWIYTQS